MSAVVYEVTLRVRPAIATAYRAWLDDHVREIVALPGFLDARVSLVVPDEADAVVFCCHYRLRDQAAFDAYLRDHAPRMREDGLRRFGDVFTATRRVLEVLDEVTRPD